MLTMRRRSGACHRIRRRREEINRLIVKRSSKDRRSRLGLVCAHAGLQMLEMWRVKCGFTTSCHGATADLRCGVVPTALQRYRQIAERIRHYCP